MTGFPVGKRFAWKFLAESCFVMLTSIAKSVAYVILCFRIDFGESPEMKMKGLLVWALT